MEDPRRYFLCFALFSLLIWDLFFLVEKAYAVTSSQKYFPQSPRYAGNDNEALNNFSIFSEAYKSIDLGLGLPDYDTPNFLKEALIDVIREPDSKLFHQYTRLSGHERLVKILAKLYSEQINRQLDPMKNVMVAVGATEALFAAFQSLTFPGNEWIVFEPFYYYYMSMITIAGGVPRFVRLKSTKTSGVITSADWTFDRDELAKLFNNNTKGILLNTPHNPTGKVFTMEEVQFIADLAIKYDVIVIADEVYEWLIYEPEVKHVRIATLPGMFERTIVIGSASKTFAVTGWRIGWAYGPSNLIDYMNQANEFTVLCNTSPLQEAFARALERVYEELDHPDSYLRQTCRKLKAKRDAVVRTYSKVGISSVIPQSGYYIMSNWTSMDARPSLDYLSDRWEDMRFAKWMVEKLGIEVHPATLYYSEDKKAIGQDMIRSCFAKTDDTIVKLDTILSQYVLHAGNNLRK